MEPAMKQPILGVLVAIAITAALDASGFSPFSALPLFPLLCIFWYLGRFPRKRMGFVWGRWRGYGLAVLYPVAVIGVLGLVSVTVGAADLSHTDWKKAGLNLALVGLSTIVVAIITEEGFFRGWLIASLERAGKNRFEVLVRSSVAFSLWHLPFVTVPDEFRLPVVQVPVFMINAAAMGAVWGLLRLITGSVVVASVSHGLWNGAAYVLFGIGTRDGALGIKQTAIYSPEVGVLGLALNLIFVAALWRSWKGRNP